MAIQHVMLQLECETFRALPLIASVSVACMQAPCSHITPPDMYTYAYIYIPLFFSPNCERFTCVHWLPQQPCKCVDVWTFDV